MMPPEEPPSPLPLTPLIEHAVASRRSFLRAALAAGALGAVSGCARDRSMADLPGPRWPESERRSPAGVPADRTYAVDPITGPSLPADVLTRTRWASAQPVASRMERMRPVRYVTIHHTAGPEFTSASESETRARLDSIRRYHRDDLGWGDIGYHFAVDRAGRVWQCRPLTWQGAHVRDHNEGNIGIVALGNFDHQQPSQAQLQALTRFTAAMMRQHRVPVARLRTHQEWAATACPGRSLQAYMDTARRSGAFA